MANPTDTENLDPIRAGVHAPATGWGAEVRAAPVRFEPCAGFDPSPDDPLVCACGWLDTDHGQLADVRRRRARARPPVQTRRAS